MKKLILLSFLTAIVVASCNKDSNAPSANNSSSNKAKACFSFSPDPPSAGNLVTFDASCSQNAKFYYWALNGSVLWQDVNGNFSSHVEKSFGTYLGRGTFKVTLYAFNADSTQSLDSVSHTFTTTNAVSACFTINGSSGSGSFPLNSTVTFDASCSSDFDPSTCDWSFDGRESGPNDYGETVTHTFTTTGTHTAQLEVTDPSRTGSNTLKKTFTIN